MELTDAVAVPLMAGVELAEKPSPSPKVSYEIGWACSGSLKEQSVRFHSREDHQSFVGIGPVGALAVANCRGLLDIAPQPLGSGPTGVVV